MLAEPISEGYFSTSTARSSLGYTHLNILTTCIDEINHLEYQSAAERTRSLSWSVIKWDTFEDITRTFKNAKLDPTRANWGQIWTSTTHEPIVLPVCIWRDIFTNILPVEAALQVAQPHVTNVIFGILPDFNVMKICDIPGGTKKKDPPQKIQFLSFYWSHSSQIFTRSYLYRWDDTCWFL